MTAGTAGPDGRVIAGRYRLVGQVGSGAYGTVWRAFDEVLEVPVAVKELRLPSGTTGADDPRSLARVEREARIVAKLRDHPHVVTVLDVVTDGGLPWIVMELVESRSLATVVRSSGALPPGRVAEIGAAVLDALAAAHRAGITHRDVKPANILIGDDGRVVLADFGVAAHDAQQTITGGPVGTLAYMAPEQFAGGRGQPAGDLFSLGATLYFTLTGRPPFGRPTEGATIHAVLHDQPPRPAGPERLVDVVMGLLAKDPADRMDAVEAATALAEATVAFATSATDTDTDTTATATATGSASDTDTDADTDAVAGGPARPPPRREDPPVASPMSVTDRLDPAGASDSLDDPADRWARAGGPDGPGGSGRLGGSDRADSALDRAVGTVLLVIAAALAAAPWVAGGFVELPWWGYSIVAVTTLFFGCWAVAFAALLIWPGARVSDGGAADRA